MNTGKTLFGSWTSAMDYFHADRRPVWRRWVRTLSCAEQYRSMAFAQLTESLRDIETCLSVHGIETLSHGLPPVRRSTLADANERRDWRIHAALAQRLITQARTLYVDEELWT